MLNEMYPDGEWPPTEEQAWAMYWRVMQNFLFERFGLSIIELDAKQFEKQILENDVYAIASYGGGDWPHAVVWKGNHRNGQVVHNPFPGGRKVTGAPSSFKLFVKMDPGK